MFPAGSSASSPFSSRSTDASSPESADVKPNIYPSMTMSSFFTPAFPTGRQTSPSHPPSSYNFAPPQTAPSVATSTASTHQGGTRSEPPKRSAEVEGLRVVTPRPDELVRNTGMNRLLLQGDPQHITKQRVETAIRVILDLVRLSPITPSDPPLDPTLLPLLLRDGNGNVLTTLERVGTFRSIRLQAGTTTKTASKKQLQAGPTPKDQLLYLETAVYMSGESTQRVYACRRCRMREAKRRQSKDAGKKRPANEAEEAAPPRPRLSIIPPSQDYVTDANPDQYDPLRATQMVEEPAWDPNVADWRHEIVLFNSPPEVMVKDGSCVWLPFRVVCYGKCHGEKQGFRVKFTLRTHQGGIVATGITDPIRITDDHKTDAKAKSGVAPRSRKSRTSASVASSRRVSPAPSESESVQSVQSEVGAVIQKQSASARARPYDRSKGMHSPLASTSQIDPYAEKPVYRRTPSTTSLHSLSGLSLTNITNMNPDVMSQNMFDAPKGTVSPGVLRQPAFDFGYGSSSSSRIASPVTQPRDVNDPTLFDGSNMMAAFGSLRSLEQEQQHQQISDLDMSNAMTSGLDNIFDTSSHSSYDSASVYLPDGSMFSDSGVVPEDMQGFLDFTGGEGDSNVQQPSFDGRLGGSAEQSQQVDEILAQLAQVQANVPPPQPPANAPMISTVIPAEGPVAGGTTVAIIGANFTPGISVLFGDRTAKLQRVDPTFIQCMAPPAAAAGSVEVCIPGGVRLPGQQPTTFRYNMMDMDLMMLALQVKTQYGGASNDAAYRLAQQVASSQGGGGSEWTDNTGEGLETKVNNFFAALDAEAPGSLRSSGCINTRNEAQQTLLHIATVMGFHLLLRRLVSLDADLDVQDSNGYTALAFACLMGRTECARVLIEAGAAYDRPTGFGEMPLDLSKIAEHTEVESLVLSAVWSTKPRETPTPTASIPSLSSITTESKKPSESIKPPESVASSSSLTSSLDPFGTDRAVEPTRSVESGRSISTDSIDSVDEIDGDNPSDASDEEVVGMTKPKKLNRKRPARISLPRSRRTSISVGPVAAAEPAPADDPPPYERVVKDVNAGTMTIQLPLPDMVWNRLPLPVHDLLADGKTGGWVTISAPSWETLTKMTNPEEVRMFTQAMAAAAMNAVVQSGATTSAGALTDGGRKGRRKARSTAESRDSSSAGTGASSPRRKKIAQQVKNDRMLYLFWLPVLLFVGFWIMVTALPIVTGACFIHARQIGRAIKQRI